MIKIGVIGAGKISHRHTEAVKCIEGVTVGAVADINLERAKQLSKEYGAVAYDNYPDMIKSEGLDAVIINLPHGLHASCTRDCAREGLDILLEKPMAVNTDECSEMIAVAKEHKVKLMIGHIQRYFPENIKAKEMIESGEFGAITSIKDVRNLFYFSKDRPSWFFDKEMSGGGIMMNFGAHSLDKILWLTGSKIKSIVGSAGNALPDYEVDGHAQAFIELENNVTATLNFSGYRQSPINETTVYMTNGSLKLATGKGLWVYEGDEYRKVDTDSSINPFQIQMNDFIAYIRDEKCIENTGDYGKSIIEAIEMVYGLS